LSDSSQSEEKERPVNAERSVNRTVGEFQLIEATQGKKEERE
jgi:hypothetical protein